MKVAVMCDTTHNPFDEARWVSCLRENLTSSSYGEGLETGRAVTQVPRQSLTRQLDLRSIKTVMQMDILRCKSPEMVCKEPGLHGCNASWRYRTKSPCIFWPTTWCEP